MDISIIQIVLALLFLIFFAAILPGILKDKTALVLCIICTILFFFSGMINILCSDYGKNGEETLIYAVDLPSVPDDASELEIPEKTITAKNGETTKVPAETIDIGEVVITDDKSKVGIYEVKKHWKCFYIKENITYVYEQKDGSKCS